MKSLRRMLLPLLLAACTPDRWASMQSEWEEPDPDTARGAVEVPAGLEPGLERPSPFEPPDGDGPLQLSIEQATMLALGHNRDLAVRQLSPLRAGAFEMIERFRIGLIVAVMMGDGDRDFLARVIARGEQALAILNLEARSLADEVQACVAHQRAGKQAGLGQHLEAVANPQHRHAASSCIGNCAHDR